MSEEITIYHNPRCSKSRQTLALLEEKGLSPSIVLYLDAPPSLKTLKQIAKKLNCSARDMMRKKESIYSELQLSKDTLSEDALFQAMSDNPKLIERPIVVKGQAAIIGRPPENVLNLI